MRVHTGSKGEERNCYALDVKQMQFN